MDLSRAFSYVFDDDEWLKKILIGGLISLVPLIGGFVIYGYMLEVARRVFDAPDINRLPEWEDFGGYLTRGFLFWLGLALWASPFVALFICGVLMVIFLGLASGEEAIIGVSAVVFYVFLMPAVLFFSLISALVIPLLLGRYSIEMRFAAMFEFSEIIEEVRRVGALPLLLLVVTYLVAGSLGQLGVFLCFIGVIFTTFYGNLAVAHAAGQTYRLARGIRPPESPAERPTGY